MSYTNLVECSVTWMRIEVILYQPGGVLRKLDEDLGNTNLVECFVTWMSIAVIPTWLSAP